MERRFAVLTHEAGGVALVDTSLAVNLDEALHEDGGHLLVGERVLDAYGRTKVCFIVLLKMILQLPTPFRDLPDLPLFLCLVLGGQLGLLVHVAGLPDGALLP